LVFFTRYWSPEAVKIYTQIPLGMGMGKIFMAEIQNGRRLQLEMLIIKHKNGWCVHINVKFWWK
jgi:hypothetical protein